MTDPFLAEIRIFGFNFAPTGWAYCDGQLLPISQNTALFSLLGTTYGGDGRSTFSLPDLMGRAPMHPEQGPGLSLHDLGETGGAETVSLLISEIPAHSHTLGVATGNPAESNAPAGQVPSTTNRAVYSPTAGTGFMAQQALSVSGASLPHNNMQPYLTMNFCIAMQGIFPPRP